MEGLDFAKRGDVVRLEQALEDDREGTIRWRHRNGDTLGHIASRKGHLQVRRMDSIVLKAFSF